MPDTTITLDFSKLSDEDVVNLSYHVERECLARKRNGSPYRRWSEEAERYFATADRTVTLQVRDDA